MKKLNQSGVLHPVLIGLIALVIIIIGFTLYRVFRSDNPKSTLTSVSQFEEQKFEETTEGNSDEETAEIETQDKPAETLLTDKQKCADGEYKNIDGNLYCVYTFTANDFPARLEAFGIQQNPLMSLYTEIELIGTCEPSSSCQNFSTEGNYVAEGQYKPKGARLDWKIIDTAKITIMVLHTTNYQNYSLVFSSYAYEHPKEPICTSLHYYCYGLRTNFDRR